MNHRLRLWTGIVGVYRGRDGLNITVKNNKNVTDSGWLFAPTWTLVGGHRHFYALQTGNRVEIDRWRQFVPLTDEEYLDGCPEKGIVGFRDVIRTKYKAYKHRYVELFKNRDELTLLCYCPYLNADGSHKFCHRDESARIALQIMQHIGINAEYRGQR